MRLYPRPQAQQSIAVFFAILACSCLCAQSSEDYSGRTQEDAIDLANPTPNIVPHDNLSSGPPDYSFPDEEPRATDVHDNLGPAADPNYSFEDQKPDARDVHDNLGPEENPAYSFPDQAP